MKHLLLLATCLVGFHWAIAHGGHDDKKAKHTSVSTKKGEAPDTLAGKQVEPDSAHHDSAHSENEADEATTEDVSGSSANHPQSMNEFPTLHPLIVHFPIMFLLIAAVFQLVQFFVFGRELSWVVVVLVTLGYVGAYVSGTYVHPHTHGLSDRAAQILAEHDLYADWTVWLSGIGVVLKGISHFFLHRRIWAEMVVALVLLGAAYSVAMAGHHGAQLVHIKGVGPQGKYLEMHHAH